MEELPKRRRTSRGRCALCGAEFGKAQMTRHLEKHQAEQDAATGPGTKRYHLLVEGRHSPEYWLHLDVQADATLRDLDSFLRGIWLECCGHLSAFEINDARYDVTVEDTAEEEEEDEEDDDFFGGLGLMFGGPPPKSMSIRLSEALTPGTKFTHQYDFGSTTELKLRVVSEHEGDPGPDAVRLLARNVAPEFECEKCGEPAVWLGTDEEGEYRELCQKCAKRAKRDEWLLPIVNSPRAGVCGYEGPSREYPV
jgi:hypothetical protein